MIFLLVMVSHSLLDVIHIVYPGFLYNFSELLTTSGWIDVLSPVPWFDFFGWLPKLILLPENRRDFLDGNGSGNRKW